MHRWLCVVTNRQRFNLSPIQLIRRVQWLAAAGVDLVQIRERDLSDRDLTMLVRDAVAATRGTSARVVVNDRADVALAADAAGVHLREDSSSADRVRAFVPPGFLIGCSIHDSNRARASSACDYLLFGTVFPSSGKPAGHTVAGLARLRDACAAASCPVLGIGGIAVDSARDVVRAGAAGVAAIASMLSVTTEEEARRVVSGFRRAFDAADRDH